MKHLLPLTSLIALLSAPELQAQLIYISDPMVRTAYNSWVPGCVDGGGYLDPSFPGVATYDGTNPMLSGFGGGAIEGLDAFTALQRVGVFADANNGDITLQSLPPQLARLWITTGGAITWPAIPSTLQNLWMSSNASELPPLPAGLKQLWVHDMVNLVAMPVLPAGLVDLSFGGLNMDAPFPDITGLDLQRLQFRFMSSFTMPALPASLRYLSLVSVSLPENLTFPAGLDTLQLIGATINDLPGLPPALINLTVYDYIELNGVWWTLPELPATLQKLELWGCPISYLPDLPASLTELFFMNGSNITCLPPLPQGLQLLTVYDMGAPCLPNIPPGCIINSEYPLNPCFILGGICPAVSANVEGQVFRDIDQDGVQDAGEPASNFVQITVAPLGLAGGIPVDGHYLVQLPPGDYTIAATPSSPLVQSIAPATHTVSLADETSTDIDNNFGLDITTANDLAVTIVTNPARPGFNNEVWLNVRNLGTEVTDAIVHFTADADQSWVASDVVPNSLSGNTATWTLDAMAMGEMRSIQVTLNTEPAVTAGTALDHLASVDLPPDDVDENNNSASYHDVVVASCDPNDKTVSPSVIDASELATAEFTYTIRFQNTGNYHAERVIITDTLSASLDWNSFRFIASSHTCNWTLYNGVLRFTFEPIFLPDSTSDEIGSHGFVTFAMKPDPSAGLGPIGNVANIYFDFNAPVITNEAVVDISTAVAAENPVLLRAFPVPAQNTLWVERPESTLARFVVFDAQGRQLLSMSSSATLVALPVEELPSGAYVVEVRDDRSTRVPFVKY